MACAASLLEDVAIRGADPMRDGWGMETDPQRVAERCAGIGGDPALVATPYGAEAGQDPSETYGYAVDADGVPCDTGGPDHLVALLLQDGWDEDRCNELAKRVGEAQRNSDADWEAPALAQGSHVAGRAVSDEP